MGDFLAKLLKKRDPQRAVWILVFVINGVFALSSIIWLLYSHQRYEENASFHVKNLTRSLEISVTSVIRSLDLAIDSTAHELALCKETPRARCLPPEELLLSRTKGITESQGFFITDADGNITATVPRFSSHANELVSLAERDYFQRLKRSSDNTLVFSAPLKGKLTGKWTMAVARPILSSHGRFLGAVIAALDLEWLQQKLSEIKMGPHGALALRDAEMGVVLRFPEPSGIGSAIGSKSVSKVLADAAKFQTKEGSYRAVAPLDGFERSCAFAHSTLYPFFINVGLASVDYLAPWRKEVMAAILVQVIALFTTSISGWALLRLYRAQTHEIERRKSIERTLELALGEMNAITQSPLVGLAMVREGKISWVNGTCCRLFDADPEEIIANPSRLFGSSEGGAHDLPAMALPVVKGGGIFRVQLKHLKKDGTSGWYDVSSARLNPNEDSSVWAFVDISALKATEIQLVEARRAAENANIAKSQFLATMSHELRTPLNGVVAMSALLADSELNPQQRHYIEVVNQSVDSLQHLINDILDFSKIDAGKIDLETRDFDLRKTIESSISSFNTRAKDKGLRLSFTQAANVPTYLQGDQGRVRQIFSNFLSNAIKFTERGSISVRLELEKIDNQKATIRCTVQDTGIGIPIEKQDRLFQVFSQVDSSITRRYGGTGLGLAISRQLAKLMDGDVGMKSEVGVGSEFWFSITLPLGKMPVASDDQSAWQLFSKGEIALRKDARILVAEDNPTNQLVFTDLLKKLGLTSELVENGRDAVESVRGACANHPFDLVLMDIHMPVMDGIEATAKIRGLASDAEPSVRNAGIVPIVAVTANAMKGDRERFIAAGMNDYLTKPLDLSRLITTLDYWLKPGVKSNVHALNQTTSLTKEGTEPSPALAVFHPPSLLERLGNDMDLARQLVETFITDMPRRLIEFDRALKAKDIKSLTITSHAIKGAAATLSGQQLSALAFEFEKMAKAGQIDQMEHRSAELSVAFQKLEAELSAWKTSLSLNA